MKDTSHPEEPATAVISTEPPEHVGKFLQQERLLRNKSLQEVAAATCIHVHILQALEEGNRSKLPAEVFVRGFISLYAQHLGLDVQEVLNRYGRKSSTAWTSPGIGYDDSDGLPRREKTGTSRRVSLLLLLTVLAALLAYGGYLQLEPWGANQAGPDVQLLSPGGEETLSEADLTGLEGEGGDSLPDSKTAPGPEQPAPESAPPLSEPRTGEASSAAGALSGPATSEGDPPVPPETPASPPLPPPAPESAHILTAEFTESTWLRIQVDNRAAVEYTFRPGERHRWQARERIIVFLGNAGGVEFDFNGQRQPRPGRSGQTARLIFPGRS